ncbi:MAG: hypothetical protein GZ086_05650 [Gelidibacter sp.]|nr:hypothetical protein [Gelidibacter sp.]
MKNLIFTAFLIISNTLFSQTIDITVIGSWMKTINASDISEAGNDYPAAYTSNTNQTIMTINPKNSSKLIYVFVKKTDIDWNNNLNLKIKRNSNGTNGNSSINGGIIFQTITNIDTNFFTCTGPFVNVPFQYEITGISVLLPVQNYSTTIMFTVMH